MALKYLKIVREQRQFQLEEVADTAAINANRLRAIEEGTRDPTYIQIEKLAAALGVAPYILASDTLPNLPLSLPDFRRESPAPARLSPGGARRVWQSESISDFASQMLVSLGYDKPLWTKDVPTGPVGRKLASDLRQHFDQWLAPRLDKFQLLGPRDQKVLQSFRIYVEVQGVAMSINDAPSQDYFGFYTNSQASVPIAFINRKILSKKAQLFTAVHEFAHHLLKADGVSNPFLIRNATERTCNQFAAEFLAPMETFTKHVEQHFSDKARLDLFGFVGAVATSSLLSRHATAIRLKEAGFITEAQLTAWERVFVKNIREEKDEDQGADFGQVHAKRLSEIGYLPTFLASRGLKEGAVDSIDVRNAITLPESLQEKAFDLVERRFETAGDR